MMTRVERAVAGMTIALVAAATLWTILSSSALSVTFDEPHHLATGIEWWQFGTYRWWTENPPLPKILTALGPYLAGVRLPGPPATLASHPWDVGINLLDEGGAHTLMLARAGTIPFLVLTFWFTFALAGGRKELIVASLATALVATYPPLLGHAGLATTDIAAVAAVLGFLLALDRWVARPSRRRAVVVGVALAAASLCKLTAPLFCTLLGAGWLAGRRLSRDRWFDDDVAGRELLAQVALAAAGAFVVIWAGYRFSIGRLDDLPAMNYMGAPVLPPAGSRSRLLAWFCRLRLPAPEFWHGILFLRAHDAHGHLAYLFGETREHGFRTFYWVGLLLKSPLPFLLLAGAAAPLLLRRAGRLSLGPRGVGAALAGLAALALSTVVTVNIGLRHLLVVVPLLAIFAARGAVTWVAAVRARWRTATAITLALLMAAQVAIVERARPELMAYFNPLAGREPGRALIDSDLDWGQDLLLLERELRARGITSLHYGLFAIVNPCDPQMPALVPLEPQRPVTGWVVLSEQFYRSGLHFSFRRESCAPHAHYRFNVDPRDAFDWLKSLSPVARVGASLRLYYVPERPVER